MKRILMRAGMSPLVNYDTTEVLAKNLFGNNIGNMLFQSSVCRTIMHEKVIIDTIHTKRKYSNEEIKRINGSYECLVLPFANAFRLGFIDELNNTTDLINKLTIPCIVVGIGAQANLKGEGGSEELDKAVKAFMKAVLKKSNMVGLRGEFTAAYLTRLGFQAERDFTVVGCPSLYMYGKELPKMEVKELTPDSNVSMNSKISLPQKFHDFMYRSSQMLPNHHYVPQVIEEINRMYIGKPYPKGFAKRIPNHFPESPDAPVYTEGKGISFVNLPSWLDYLRAKDFSFGSRIHGNIAAILAGTPCFIVVSDKRIMELVDYHNIPNILMDELNSSTNIFDLYEKADFSAMQKGHEERFQHYLDFLHDNGLKTIFDGDQKYEMIPYDRRWNNIGEYEPAIKPYSCLTSEEQLRRLESFHLEEGKKIKYYRNLLDGMPSTGKELLKYIIKAGSTQGDDTDYYPFIREFEEEKRLERKMKRRRENQEEKS